MGKKPVSIESKPYDNVKAKEGLELAGFADQGGGNFLRAGNNRHPDIKVELRLKPDAKERERVYVTILPQPFKVHGSFTKAPESLDPEGVVKIVRGWMQDHGVH